MLKYSLVLFGFLIVLAAASAYAEDTPPVLLGPSGWNDPDAFRDPNLPDNTAVPVKPQAHAHHNHHKATCGVEGKPACVCSRRRSSKCQNPNGVNQVTGLTNNNAGNTAPGGVNRITGQVNGVKSTPCGVGGQGCAKQGPGGVSITGKVNPY